MGKTIIINALVWATIILLLAFFLKDYKHYDLLFGFSLIGFTLVNGYLMNINRKKKNKEA